MEQTMQPSARPNLAERAAERWRPPLLDPPDTAGRRWAAAVRRFFDLQAGSIWTDVAAGAGSARGKVVDVGCGAQPYRALFPAGTEYVGLDIAQAGERFGYAQPDTVFFDGGAWPERTHDADFVLCTETLEHVLDPTVLLREAHAALRPGGRLLLTVPFAARWHFIPHDFWRFTPSSLSHLLQGAGFKNVVVWARGNALTVACYKVMALFLPLLFPQDAKGPSRWGRRLLSLPAIPLFVTLAGVANLSLRADGGDDCLGFTVTAERP
jgi:SAM-dependent methyltransferase